MAAKPIKYTAKAETFFTPEQKERLIGIANENGETLSGLLRRLGLKCIAEHEKGE